MELVFAIADGTDNLLVADLPVIPEQKKGETDKQYSKRTREMRNARQNAVNAARKAATEIHKSKGLETTRETCGQRENRYYIALTQDAELPKQTRNGAGRKSTVSVVLPEGI